jgi:hypothetical protein
MEAGSLDAGGPAPFKKKIEIPIFRFASLPMNGGDSIFDSPRLALPPSFRFLFFLVLWEVSE